MNKILQTQFEKFHEKIKLKNFQENKKLRAKRDMLLNEIRDYLAKKSNYRYGKKITFHYINQGSYAMSTGVKPLIHKGDDYDIDIGLAFNVSTNDFSPTELKELVKEALEIQASRTVEMKRSCVRVQYTKKGKLDYHVDLAIYSNNGNQMYLAKGYLGSAEKYKIWQKANPEKLKKIIANRFQNQKEKAQFKRVIRYMKRWKDIHFKSKGNSRPTGIALTALALKYFQPKIKNTLTYQEEINDLEAIKCFVDKIIEQFQYSRKTDTYNIITKLPVEPYNDLFEKMKKSDEQVKQLKKKLEYLQKELKKAKKKIDPVKACEILKGVFGDDFEVPDKKDTAAKTIAPAIASSSEQA